MFAEFTRKSGNKVTVNSDKIIYISPTDDNQTNIYVEGTILFVTEDYGTVVSKLTGRFTRRAAAGVGL